MDAQGKYGCEWCGMGKISMKAAPLLLIVCLVPACDGGDGASTHPAAPPEAIPSSVALGPANVTVGFSSGVIRAERAVGALRVSLVPTTVAQYRLCVESGACAPPSASSAGCQNADDGRLRGRTFDSSGGGDRPVTCCTVSQASAYCRWVGGRLPTEAEWLLLARGAKPQRYSWGNAAPTCAQHPNTGSALDELCGDGAGFAVGTHPEGASPVGAQDVLLAAAELIGPSNESYFVGCRPPGAGCLASGFAPGSIDVLLPVVSATDAPAEAYSAHAFRCVWENEG